MLTRVHSLTGSYVRALDDDRLHWTPPGRIHYSALTEFNLLESKGYVLDGDWDRLEKPFENLDVYVAFREVLVEKRKWQQTVYYQRLLARIQRGEMPWGCRTQEDLDQRCAKLSALAEAIGAGGYKSQTELHPIVAGNPFAGKDEITVSIGREGDLLFSNSAHRLAAAKVLGIPQVPIRIAVRHRAWLAFRRELEAYAAANGGLLPQPALHPDLSHIPARRDCVERLDLLCPHLPPAPARILVVGAELGYECHRLEDLGYGCFTGEANGEIHPFLGRLRRAENRRFHIVPEPLLTWSALPDLSFDAVLLTRSFPWELAHDQRRCRLAHFLRMLRTPLLFLEGPASPGCRSNAAPPAPYGGAPDEDAPNVLLSFVRAETRLGQVACIGFVGDTPLYKFN
ncbi:MAG TPA: hypothetical protein VNK95_22845 [Caldilineaceae bacterium]|nr:hypothetical protein [Caldilineaceae bacterium]